LDELTNPTQHKPLELFVHLIGGLAPVAAPLPAAATTTAPLTAAGGCPLALAGGGAPTAGAGAAAGTPTPHE